MKEGNVNKVCRVIALIAATAMLFSGCGNKKTDTVVSQGTVTYPANGTYPVSSEDELSLWIPLTAVVSAQVSNFGDTPLAKEMEKVIGAKVTYIHPATGMEKEQFNLLLASDGMPDIISYDWYKYGGDKAIDEGYIQPLNEVIDKWAPNLKKVLSDMPEIDGMLRTDSGRYYAFPFIRENLDLCVYGGPIIRADWLKKLNMDVPETIDEWDTMLTAFKEKLGATAPLSIGGKVPFNNGMIIGAYGITTGFYVDGNQVKYGPVQPEYKEFLLKMREWYQKGLLDSNFSGTDSKILESNMLNNKSGVTYGLTGSNLGAWLMAKKSTNDTEFDLVGAPYPTLNKGDKPQFGQMDWQYSTASSWAITKSCKNVELAARYLDYGYSEEGYNLYNYGPEGVTWEMKDGVPTFTDFVWHNPDGDSATAVINRYSMGNYGGPCVQSWHLKQSIQSFPQQNEAVEAWKKTDMSKHAMPLVTLTAEEAEEKSSIFADLDTYMWEMLYSFIMGTADLSEYDNYVSRMKQLGVDRVVELQQQALDRYNAR